MSNKSNHKAATEVTVAPLEERSGFEEFVFKHWWKGVLVFLVVVAAIVFSQTREQQIETVNDRSWSRLSEQLAFIESPSGEADPSALEDLGAELQGTLAGPWADALLAPAFAERGQYDAALAELERFVSAHPDHPLRALQIELDGERTSPVEALEARLTALAQFRETRPELFDNPAPPADSPRVRLNTTAGQITLALYQNEAPGHTENFLSKVRAGEYDGTKFHRVIPGFMIQGGDPNSIAGDPSTWGQGGGEITQPQEFGDLAHFRGYLAMAKRGNQVESSTSQFYITLGEPHHLNGQHTVFGKVLEGMDVATAIGNGAIADGTADRPAQPVTIESATVLGE